MADTIFEILGKTLGMVKTWQWLYSVKNSPLWSITPFFMDKESFLRYKDSYNESHKHFPITEYQKAKPTKRFRANITDSSTTE